jgi:hypothetical protein
MTFYMQIYKLVYYKVEGVSFTAGDSRIIANSFSLIEKSKIINLSEVNKKK